MSTIKIKRSGTGGQAPAAGDLAYGELALNYADGKLYYKDATNAVAEIGAGGGAGGLDSAGVISLTGAEVQTSAGGLDYTALDKLRVEGGAIGLSTIDADTFGENLTYSSSYLLAGNPSGASSQRIMHNLWSSSNNDANLTASNDVYVGSRYAGTKFSHPSAGGMTSYVTTAARFGGGFKWDHAGTQALFLTADSADFNGTVKATTFEFADGTSMTTAPTGGGSGGLDSAAIRAMMLDSVSTSSLTISETVDSGQTAVLTFDSDNNALFSGSVTAGSVTASSFIGDGSQLTGISAGSSGLDSAAVNAMIDSDFNDTEVLTFGTNSTVITIGRSAANYVGVAIGNQADASGGLYNVAIGTSAKATTSNGTVAVGHNAKAQAASASAFGRDALANNQNTLALGTGAQATGSYAKGIGGNATGNYSVAVGSTASGVGTTSMGYGASAVGTSSVALGNNATTASNAQYGIAIGRNAGADDSQTIHINATGQTTNQPQTAYGIAIETSPYGSLTYDTTNDWTFGAAVTAPAFIGDGSQLTGISAGSSGLDSAAVTTLVDSDYVAARAPAGGVSNITITDPNDADYEIPADYASVSEIAIGNGASVKTSGFTNRNSIAIGLNASTGGQGSISIGTNVQTNGAEATVLGSNAGNNSAGEMVCIGNHSKADTYSVSIGYEAGAGDGFGARNVAVGHSAGRGNTTNSVAIGFEAGETGSARNNSIAIGYQAGRVNQAANNIIVNATGSTVNRTDQYGIDIRTSTAGSLTYDTTDDWTFGAEVSAPALTVDAATSDWKFSVSGDDLIISFGGTSKAKLDTDGNLTVVGDVTAFGTI